MFPRDGLRWPIRIESDLNLELGAVASYNKAIKNSVENGDNGSCDLFVHLLKQPTLSLKQRLPMLAYLETLPPKSSAHMYLADSLHAVNEKHV